MQLEEIDRLGLNVIRDPEIRIPMLDALEDYGLTWQGWLERGTLAKLGAVMSWVMDAELYPAAPLKLDQRLHGWLWRVGAPPDTDSTPTGACLSWYFRLLAAWGVPRGLIQVGDPLDDGQWDPPTPALAEAFLKLAIRKPDELGAVAELPEIPDQARVVRFAIFKAEIPDPPPLDFDLDWAFARRMPTPNALERGDDGFPVRDDYAIWEGLSSLNWARLRRQDEETLLRNEKRRRRGLRPIN